MCEQVSSSGDTLTLDDQSSDEGSGIVEWVWDFGDGSSSLAQSPVHTYVLRGSFDVTLTITDAAGWITSLSKIVYLQGCALDFDCDAMQDSSDNCASTPNPDQLNSDRNFIDQTPPSTQSL